MDEAMSKAGKAEVCQSAQMQMNGQWPTKAIVCNHLACISFPVVRMV